VIVLVHSGVADATMWDGFDVPGTRHEMRGFGTTPLPASGEFSHVDDLEAALGGEPSTLIGASFGGAVCLRLASTRPELVTELVVLDAPLFDHDWSEEMTGYFEAEDALAQQGDLDAVARFNVDFWVADEAVRGRVLEMQRRGLELQAGSEAEEVTPADVDLGAITARTLVVVGELDKPDFRAIAERLAREIPNAESAVIEGAGHLPSLERSEATASVICSFLTI
jgi:pimeloyl-ACP methyl ester carboxylesterase